MNKYILDMPDENVFIARDDVYVMTIGNSGNIKTTGYDTVSDYLSGKTMDKWETK